MFANLLKTNWLRKPYSDSL